MQPPPPFLMFCYYNLSFFFLFFLSFFLLFFLSRFSSFFFVFCSTPFFLFLLFLFLFLCFSSFLSFFLSSPFSFFLIFFFFSPVFFLSLYYLLMFFFSSYPFILFLLSRFLFLRFSSFCPYFLQTAEAERELQNTVAEMNLLTSHNATLEDALAEVLLIVSAIPLICTSQAKNTTSICSILEGVPLRCKKTEVQFLSNGVEKYPGYSETTMI